GYRPPGCQDGTVDIDLIVVLVLDQAHPVVEPSSADSRLQLSGCRILLVELLEIVGGRVWPLHIAAAAATAAATERKAAADGSEAGQHVDEHRVRFRELGLDREIVDLDEFAGLAIDRKLRRWSRRQ